MNTLAVARDDKFRGKIEFSFSYCLKRTQRSAESIGADTKSTIKCETARIPRLDGRKDSVTPFITRILEKFDQAFVRVGGGGWRDADKKSYGLYFVCRAHGTNKQR